METSEKLFKSFNSNMAVVSSSKVYKGEFRLTAEFFKVNTLSTFKNDLEFVPLSTLASVIGFGPFKRYYIENDEHGIPLISSSEMMEANPSCEKYISKSLHKDYEKYLVEKGWILVSCSGTIGNITVVDNRFKGFAVSQHALRVIPKEEKLGGYLYTYLSSETGQSEMKGKKSGAIIDEIYEADLLRLSIPVIDEKAIENLSTLIDKAILLREEANDLLNEADKLVNEYNRLPPLNIIDAEYFDSSGEIQSRILKSSELRLDNRFDAHYYNPIFELNTEIIYNNSQTVLRLNELCLNIFLCYRFPRNFVEAKNGIPLIGTKNTLQIRPTEMKYISKMDVENDSELIAQEYWILLARVGSLGGTFGKVAFVWKNFEGYIASDNIIRIVPDSSKIDPAYLFAYLNSFLGYNEIIRLRHGALQDALDVNDIRTIPVPIPGEKEQNIISDKVRLAYEKRAGAIRLEDEAQTILKQSLTE